MSAHTPDDCGCKVVDGQFVFCPTHGAAPDLLVALEALEASFVPDDDRDHYRPHRSDEENRVKARAAIAKARGDK